MRTSKKLAFSAALVGLLSACGKTTPPPAPAAGGGGGGTNPAGNVIENPNSLLGRSAKTAKNTVRAVGSAQDAAVGTAQEMSGEADPLALAGLAWSSPSKWTKVKPASTMRAAEFKVASDAGNGEASVAFFTGLGGDPTSNIDRWRGQFSEPGGTPPEADLIQRKIAECKVWLVTIRGMFKGGQPGGPADDAANYGMRGAIIDGPKGMVFIKFMGPEATLVENESAWSTMVNGMRKQ